MPKTINFNSINRPYLRLIIETNWQGLLLLLVNPFAGAFKLIYDNCEGFRTKVNEVVSAVLNTLRELPAQVLSVGRNLVEGLWNGIQVYAIVATGCCAGNRGNSVYPL